MQADNGFCDFVIPAPYGVALKLTCDGSNLEEHLQLLRLSDIYKDMYNCGFVNTCAVVDMRSHKACRDSYISHENLYTVVFSEDWQQATVWHLGQSLGTLQLECRFKCMLCTYTPSDLKVLPYGPRITK
jgi:hypothetical protein